MENKTQKLLGLAFFISVPVSAFAKSTDIIPQEIPASFSELTDESDEIGEEMISQPTINCG